MSDGLHQRARNRLRRAYRDATSGLRLLPSFLIIGAARAGTTSLYSYLVRHPSVRAPTHKELHFFDLNYERGLDWYRRHFPAVLPGNREGSLTGEASPYYLFHPAVPSRVAQTLPDVRLIALLRNPVDRAYSQHQLASRHGRDELSFEQAVAAEPERLAGESELSHRHHSYLARGLYAEQLERWYEHFPREQLLVLRSEDFFSDPPAIYADVLRFLELPPYELREYRAYNQKPYDGLSPALREELERYFAGPNRRLADLLGRDLGWD
ncbi:MAG: sulfotransferase family protein [Gaiellaceae bacterium]